MSVPRFVSFVCFGGRRGGWVGSYCNKPWAKLNGDEDEALIINTVNSRNELHLISPYKINMSFSRQVAIATGRN